MVDTDDTRRMTDTAQCHGYKLPTGELINLLENRQWENIDRQCQLL